MPWMGEKGAPKKWGLFRVIGHVLHISPFEPRLTWLRAVKMTEMVYE